MIQLVLVAFCTGWQFGSAFVVPRPALLRNTHSTTSLAAGVAELSGEGLAAVGYTAKVDKPLGVVFGENSDPYYGLVVNDIDPDMNGSNAGLRIGDQLLSVNGQSVVGQDFDSAMSMLTSASSHLELQLYRGNVRALYTTLDNMNLLLNEDDEEEVVIMDENYESPVRIEVEEEKPFSPGDVLNAFKAIGSALKSDNPPKKKESNGLFGGMFSQETIQLEGDDAKGLKRQKKN